MPFELPPPKFLIRTSSQVKLIRKTRSKSRQNSSSRKDSDSYSSAGEEDFVIPHINISLDPLLPIEYFKQDVLTLIHTLKINGWKKIDKSQSNKISVTRLSGALTNSVYRVSPPPCVVVTDPVMGKKKNNSNNNNNNYNYNNNGQAQELLLRVYGTNAEKFIDRNEELGTLSKLAKHNIGPKLLGTFINGRFEEFLNATTLTKEDIRIPEMSRQIARRMRELHDLIPATEIEKSNGPMCWNSITKWFKLAESVFKRLDASNNKPDGYFEKKILHSSLSDFISAFEKYKKWLLKKYNSQDCLNKDLVFAHNDTQYGNLLRINPSQGSPLLIPKNEHRRLLVIDFEYSGLNMRGYDIANHFCEWMSDYYDPEHPEHIHEKNYPTPKEQVNLVTAYVDHGIELGTTGDPENYLQEIQNIITQTKDWRISVHVFWCIWGVVQTPIHDELAEQEEKNLLLRASSSYQIFNSDTQSLNETLTHDLNNLNLSDTQNPSILSDLPKDAHDRTLSSETEEETTNDFDYTVYSSQKAELFWADMIKFNIISESEYDGPLKKIAY